MYITEGALRVTVGGAIHEVSAGDTIFLPRGIPHTFRITSSVARALAVITPSGFEKWFQTIGSPAKNFDLPERSGPPAPEMLERMITLSAELGVRIIEDKS